MMTAPALDTLLVHTADIARAAGGALVDHRAAWATIDDVQGREVKIAADRKAEALIVARLQEIAPYPILSEETGWIAGAAGAYAWALDPLDGSVNYLQGFPHWGVSIALLRDGDPVLGVVHLPALDECFVGAVGLGATLNGRPIAVSSVADPTRGVLMTGIPARAKTDEASFAAFMTGMLAWRKVRMIGSAAAALAYVAAGRADAYRESGAMLWDVAAGCALVKAAGGVATTEGAALDAPLLVRAGNGAAPV